MWLKLITVFLEIIANKWEWDAMFPLIIKKESHFVSCKMRKTAKAFISEP